MFSNIHPLNNNKTIPFMEIEIEKNKIATTITLVQNSTKLPNAIETKKRPQLKLNISWNQAAGKEGNIIGQGLLGVVREDPKNEGFVIKDFNKNYELACAEAQLFNQYYGDGSAEVLRDGNSVRVKMLKVPGKSLDQCAPDELPENSKLLFLRMISELNELKIIHGDMHPGNIMFDPISERFWPIDISNGYSNYYSSHEVRNMMQIDNEHRFDTIMKLLP